jgi:hypothetical protein
MRAFGSATLVFLAATAIASPLVSFAQNAPPPWPQIPLDSCPALAQARDLSQRTWKHGDAERNSFAASAQMFQAKNYTAAADGFAKFAEEYPDSDYTEIALAFEVMARGNLKDRLGVLKAAEQIVRLPVVDANIQEKAFVELCEGLFLVRPDDPQQERKLQDLEKWTRCGEQALAARLRQPNTSQDTRKISESVLSRTAGYVAFRRQNYTLADARLEAAAKINPQDPLTYLWLGANKFYLPVPDPNSGVFYYARAANLAPEAFARLLKQTYVIVHGSEKGLADVRKLAESNTDPPPGFNVLPKPKKEHHYGNAIAATAIAGLLIYGFAKNPELMGAMGRAYAGSLAPPQQTKLMIFGGPGHRVYLGCLSCSEIETDSVFNPIGPHGSKVSSESIWNVVSDYGSRVSPYSACNPLATDPPVIVDQEGSAYGRLTANQLSPDIGQGARFYNWLASVVCHR